MRETIKHILVDLGARFFVEAESGRQCNGCDAQGKI